MAGKRSAGTGFIRKNAHAQVVCLFKVFYGCKNLKNITIKTSKLTAKKVGSKAFKGIHKKAVIKVPKSKVKAYKTILKGKGIGKSAKVKK